MKNTMEDNEIHALIHEKTKGKLESKTFWTLFGVMVTCFIIISGGMFNLYVMYFSGISDLKTDMAVVKVEVKNINDDMKSINNFIDGFDFKLE